MRILKFFLCLLIFASIVPAQQETIVPVATEFYLLGGSRNNGKWLTADAVMPTIEKKTRMVFVTLKGIAKGEVFMMNTGEETGRVSRKQMDANRAGKPIEHRRRRERRLESGPARAKVNRRH